MKSIFFLDIDDVLCVERTINTKLVLAALAGDETVNAAHVCRGLHSQTTFQPFNPDWY